MTPMNMKCKISMMQLLLAVMAATPVDHTGGFCCQSRYHGSKLQTRGIARAHQPARRHVCLFVGIWLRRPTKLTMRRLRSQAHSAITCRSPHRRLS